MSPVFETKRRKEAMTMNHARCLLLTAAVAAASIISTPTHAADSKIFSGLTCMPFIPAGSTSAVGWGHLDFTLDGAITNRHTTRDAGLICAIERDSTSSSTGYTSARLDVFNNGRALACTLYSLDHDSTSQFGITVSTSAVGYVGLPYGSASSGANWGLSLNCTVPISHPTNGFAFLKALKVNEP